MISVTPAFRSSGEKFIQAGENLGFTRNQIYLQDYDESFYYYVMNHRKDNWNRKIGWFLFEENQVSFARLVMDNQKRPITAFIEHGITAGAAAGCHRKR